MSEPSSPANGERDEAHHRGPLRALLRDFLHGLGRGRNGGWRESLEELIEEHEADDQALSAEERLMLANIVTLGEKRVDDVMVPRADIVAIDVETDLEQAVEVFRDAAHSRIPLYRGSLDDIVAMLHIKDLVHYWGRTGRADLMRVARQPLFVPPSMPVLDLMVEMRAKQRHLAIVVDEYGGTDGLVTIEDLIEEVVGEIRDEHDTDQRPDFVVHPDGTIDADARTDLEEFEAKLGVDLLPAAEDEEVDTLGGMIFAMLGRVPQRGEVVRHPCGLEFEVIDADPRRIKRLKVHRVEPATGDDG